MRAVQILTAFGVLLTINASIFGKLSRKISKVLPEAVSKSLLPSKSDEPVELSEDEQVAAIQAIAETQTEETTRAPSKEKKGLKEELLGFIKQGKSQFKGYAQFPPQIELFDSCLQFFEVFEAFKQHIAVLKSAFPIVKLALDSKEANARLPLGVDPSLFVIAAAHEVQSDNLKRYLNTITAVLNKVPLEPVERGRLLWKFTALSIVKLKSPEKWRTKSPRELLTDLKDAFLKLPADQQALFGIPIDKAGAVRLSGKLPWAVEPRTTSDLLNFLLVAMSNNGLVRPMINPKALGLAWEASELTGPQNEAIFKNWLNARLIDIRMQSNETTRRYVAAAMVHLGGMLNKERLEDFVLRFATHEVQAEVKAADPNPLQDFLSRGFRKIRKLLSKRKARS